MSSETDFNMKWQKLNGLVGKKIIANGFESEILMVLGGYVEFFFVTKAHGQLFYINLEDPSNIEIK